jgi:DNA-binding transcriptional regulator GbsR (MarR family)
MSDKRINRNEIAELANVSIEKVYLVSRLEHYHFPKPVENRGQRKIKYYNEEQVLAWLAKNDLKNMKIYREEPQKRSLQNGTSTLDNKMARRFLFKTCKVRKNSR